MKLTIIGCGHLGSRVAALAVDASEQGKPVEIRAITGTTTRHARLRAMGIDDVVACDATDRSSWTRPLTGHVVIAVPGSTREGEVLTALTEPTEAAPRGCLADAERVVLVGTVGAHRPYEKTAQKTPEGPLLTPDTPPAPEGERDTRTQAALATEAAFREATGDRGTVVRCGGLWHAGEADERPRGPVAAYANRGIAPPGSPSAVLPLVHYDDAASLVWAALLADAPPPTLLAVTAQPRRQAFYTAAARALGFEAPAFTASFDPRELDEPPVPPRFTDPAAMRLWESVNGPVGPDPLDPEVLERTHRALKRHATG